MHCTCNIRFKNEDNEERGLCSCCACMLLACRNKIPDDYTIETIVINFTELVLHGHNYI